MSKFVLALSLTSILFVSCGKKSNELKNPVSISALEKKSFFRVDHKQNSSLLRSKLLNSLVEEKFPSGRKELQVLPKDELDSFYTSPSELADYEEKEKTMAKIIVSFSDHLEIYFLPENIFLKDIPVTLGIAPEPERAFKWIKKADAIKTNRGNTYYLLSLNTADIVKNDERFYQETILLDKNNNKKSIPFAAGKLIELTFTHQAYIQKSKVEEVQGFAKRCRVPMASPTDCDPCMYKKVVPADGYESKAISNINDLRISLNLNGEVISLPALSPVIGGRGEIKVTRRVNVSAHGKYDIELISPSPITFSQMVSGFDYTERCVFKDQKTTLGLTEKIDVQMKMTVYGRGEELLDKIKL